MRSYRPPASGEAAALPPLAGGLVGYFGYDLVRRLEPLPDAPPDDLGLPEMAFLLADTVLVFDHLKHTITIVANAFVDGRDVDGPYERAVERIVDVRAKLAAPLPAGAAGRLVDAAVVGAEAGAERAAAGAPARPVTSSMTRDQYEAGVERIRDYIYAGDAFQVVLVPALQHARGRLAVLDLPRRPGGQSEPVPLLHRLRRLRPLRLEPRAARHGQGDRVETRPIAGTRRRGADAAEDRRLIENCAPTRRSAPST